VSPRVEATLRASRILLAGSSSLEPVSRASRRRPIRSQTASAASRRPGSKRTGRDPDAPEGRRLPGRQRDPVDLEPAGLRERHHACVVVPAAGAADGNDRIRRFIAQRMFEPRTACAAIVLAKHAPARGCDLAGDQVHGRVDHGVARWPAAHKAHARLTDVQMLHPGRAARTAA